MTPTHDPRRLMMTSFGWNDSGGGTTVPRLAAKELARRGWDVTVFHAAVPQIPGGRPYEIREWVQDGVRLIGVHNRPHGLFDMTRPDRELDDPPITAAFGAALDRLRPDVVHFHNLHNLGAALLDETFSRGIGAHFSTHNYWLICPRVYLLPGDGSLCQGPGAGERCAACTGGHDTTAYARRLEEVRARAERSLTTIFAVSEAVRRTLISAGYPADMIDVVRQAMPHETEIWERVGRDRPPGRRRDRLTVAFLGSAYPHKGPQLLIDAAQRTRAEVEIRILGEVAPRFAEGLRSLDKRGVVEIGGGFEPGRIGELLRDVDAVALPSMWWDCAPLAAAECLAARTPLLVPRLGGLPEAIREGEDGLTFDGLDAADLARQIDRLALEDGLLERLQGGIHPPRTFSEYIDELEARYSSGPGASPVARARPAAADLKVRWQGDHDLHTSLSIINRQLIAQLSARVQRVAANPRVGADGAEPGPGRERPAPVQDSQADPPLPHAADVEVRHQWPPDLQRPAAGRLAVIAPWEFGAAPRRWVEAIQRGVDELWVPSEYVRRMYVRSGVDPDRVVAIPNGVDLTRFRPQPDEPADAEIESLLAARAGPGVRFLFVGGLIWRKGPDVLLEAFTRAFGDRTDVNLVIKDFGGGGIYRHGDRDTLARHVAERRLPRVVLIDDELEPGRLAALYRRCDVLVHPYRGEGFAMPVLEAMACGLPVITTADGPTDEFCPPEAGWRIRSRRAHFPTDQVDALGTAGRPWVLEPDAEHLSELLREAALHPDERHTRGAAARRAAEGYGWDQVARRYEARLEALAVRRPLLAGPIPPEPWPLAEEADIRLLATPAWRGEDRLGELLRDWSELTFPGASACLYLLADPGRDGTPEELEQRVLAAAASAGAAIDAGADINVLMEPMRAGLIERLHAAVGAYAPLHDACAGHIRLARAAGSRLAPPGSGELRDLIGRPAVRAA